MADMNSSQHSLTSDLRDAILLRFKEGGFSNSYSYSRAKILAYMDTIGKKEFDREAGNMIFDQCPQTELGDVKIPDFAERYSEGVYITRANVNKLKLDLEERKKSLQEHRLRTDEVGRMDNMRPKDKEVLLVWISRLVLDNVSAKQVYLTLSVDSTTKKLEPKIVQPTVEVNKFVDFEFSDKSSPLTIFLYDSQSTGEKWLASADLNIHQDRISRYTQKHLEVSFLDKNQHTTGSRLHCETKAFKTYGEELKYKFEIIEREIAEVQDNLDFNQRYLEACVLPFPELDKDQKIANGLGTRLEHQRNQVRDDPYIYGPAVPTRRAPGRIWYDNLKEHPILRVALGAVTVYMLLTIFASLLRNLFFDVFICTIIAGQMFIFIHFNLLFGMKLVGGLLIQNFIDGLWLYLYGRKWWSSRYIDSQSLLFLRYLVWLSSVTLIFVRFVMMYIIVKLGYLRLRDDDDDYTSYAPPIQDVRIDNDFSQSDVSKSQL